MKPHKTKSILNPAFHYSDAAHTNIARTFARIRREQREQQAAKKAPVTQIKRAAAK